jgi:hypothetical protein
MTGFFRPFRGDVSEADRGVLLTTPHTSITFTVIASPTKEGAAISNSHQETNLSLSILAVSTSKNLTSTLI